MVCLRRYCRDHSPMRSAVLPVIWPDQGGISYKKRWRPGVVYSVVFAGYAQIEQDDGILARLASRMATEGDQPASSQFQSPFPPNRSIVIPLSAV